MQANAIENTYIRERVLNKFWPLASIVLIVFILESFFISKDYVTGWIHSANLLVLTASLWLLLKRKKILLACNMLAVIGMITILTFIFTGGPANAGFWWSIVYVIGVFLVTTKKWAIFWLSLYVLLTLVIVGLSLKGIVTIKYSIPELGHLLFVFVAAFAFVYYFNWVCEYYIQLANKRAEELTRLNKELLSANKELEEFAYVASHDLQQPLQTIENFSGLLKKVYVPKLDDDAREYFDFILGASGRMKVLIKDLLDLSRVGRNEVFTKVDCNEVVEKILAEAETSVKQCEARISASSLPMINANETELKQLFQNLIGNALKFVDKAKRPEIQISAEEKETEYLFSVKDNGIGIEEKYKNRIFIIFQRLHSADEYPGTGIGLAVCKKIVTGHRGRIWVESKPGEGSNFYFTLAKEHSL
jgi:signal transduction histidine kinase